MGLRSRIPHFDGKKGLGCLALRNVAPSGHFSRTRALESFRARRTRASMETVGVAVPLFSRDRPYQRTELRAAERRRAKASPTRVGGHGHHSFQSLAGRSARPLHRRRHRIRENERRHRGDLQSAADAGDRPCDPESLCDRRLQERQPPRSRDRRRRQISPRIGRRRAGRA